MKWSEVRWRLVQWRGVKESVPWRVFTGGEVKWKEGHVKVGVQYLWRNNIRKWVQYFLPIVLLLPCSLLLNVVDLSCIELLSYVYYFYLMCIVLLCVYCCLAYFSCRMLARSQYPGGPATGHLGTRFSWFPCVYKQMLRWFPRLQVATACFSCSLPDVNFLDLHFIFMYMHYNHWHRATAHLQLNIYYYYYYQRISHFSASAGKHSLILGYVINRNRVGGLIYNLKSSLQLNMFQELQIFAFVCTYWDAG
jgi:hypothetical protein